MCTKCGLQILIIDDDETFVSEAKMALSRIGLSIEHHPQLPIGLSYDFYVLGCASNLCEAMGKIRQEDTKGIIFLSGSSGDQKIEVKKLVKYNIGACIEKSETGINELVRNIHEACKARLKICEASRKLDRIKKKMLESSSSTSLNLITRNA